MSPAATSLPNIRGTMQEVLFAQRLANNEKKNRDRALRKLKTFIAVKSSSGPGFTDDDAIKIWKGLFYCMYMADKPLIQEQVAEDISYLIHDLGNLEDQRTFTKAAFRTFAREWNGIDIFRIDKFMMFMRRVLRQVLLHLKMEDWNLKEVARYVNILDTCIIRADDNTNGTPLGIKLHLCCIIMEELAKIGGEELSHEVIMAVIQPYLKVLAISKIKEYREKVSEEIIRHLMRQSDLGVVYEESINDVLHGRMVIGQGPEEVEAAEEEDEAVEEEEELTEEKSVEDAILDPRAGNVNAYIPQLRPDFNILAEGLQSLGSIKKVSEVNRRLVYKLVRECQDMAEGVYPLALPGMEGDISNDEDEEDVEENAVERLQEFYTNLEKTSKADIKKLGDLKQDVLKNFSVEGRRLSKKAQKKKLKRLEKKVLTFKQKKQLAKEQSAAELNRKRAVENQLCQITTAIMPDTKSSVKKQKIAEGDNKKTKKQRRRKRAKGFEVSTITPPTAENKGELSSGVNSSFEVTTIPKKGKTGKKRKSKQESGESPKKMKSSEGTEVALVSVPEVPGKVKGKKKKKKGNKVANTSSGESKSSVDNVQSPKGEKGCTAEASTETVSQESAVKNVSQDKPKNAQICKSFDVPDFSSSPQKAEQKTECVKDIKTKKKVNVEGIPKARVESEVNGDAKVQDDLKEKVVKTAIASPDIPKTPVLTPAKKTPVGKGMVMNFSEKKGSVWSKPLKSQDIEIFLKNRRQMKLEKKKASLNSPKGTPKTPKDRKIKINLKQNQEHDFKDYAHSVKNSPQIPFSADKVPKAPVLKPSPSPILIKRPALKILKNMVRKSSPGANSASPSSQRKSPKSAKFASPSLKKKSPKAKKFRSKAADFF